MASGSAGSIYVDLLLRDSGFQQGLNRANSRSRQAFTGISNEAQKAQGALAGVLNPLSNITGALGTLGISIASALSVQRIVEYSDAWRQLQGRLSIVESDMQAVGVAQEALFEVAQRNRAPLETVTNFYQRLNQFVPEAVRNQYDLLGVTESVTAAIAITGENSISAQAALVQFSQAIGTNFEASGQELRSIQEQAPRLAQALANALGGGTKSLQTLKEEGILTRDSVLRALSGMGEEGQRMAAELAKIPLTVGQAFTRLDNAFLKFIGQSEAVDAGTSSIAAAISSLAENLDTVADATLTAATLFIGSYIPAIASAGAASLSTLGTMISLNLAIGQLAFGSTTAASAMLALRGAMVTLGAALPLAALGALAYAIYEVIDGNDAAVAAEKRYAEALGEARKLQIEYIGATKKRKEEIRSATKNNIQSYMAELQSLQHLMDAYRERSNISLGAEELLGRLRNDVFSPLTGGFIQTRQLPSNIAARAEGALKNLREMQSILDKLEASDKATATETATAASEEQQKEAKKAAEELARLYEKNQRYIQGLSQEQFSYNEQIAEFNRLWREGSISYEQYVTAIETYHDELRDKTRDTFLDMEAIGKRAAENMQDAFADFLFDPFNDGLKGMLRNFVDTMRKMLAQQLSSSIFRSIAGSAFGSFLSGGFNNTGQAGLPWQSFGNVNPQGGIYTGSLFAAADGGVFGPGRWGIVGEEGPELIYTGRTGATIIPNGGNKGNVYNIDARGADQGAVRRLESALMSLAGPGVIEHRVSNAQRRGAL